MASNRAGGVVDTLIALEKELHLNATRQDRERMEQLLHPDFEEIGRSGTYYDRQAILQDLEKEKPLPPVHADDFHCSCLSDTAALLRYTSAHIGDDGHRHRFSLRSSLWLRTEAGWRLRFHQGTATQDPNLQN